MEPSKWKLTKEAFSTAIEMNLADRSAYLDKIDESIRTQVRRLIEADSLAADFFQFPAIYSQPNGLEGTHPTEIDNYEILKVLGTGGMGTVYLARHCGEEFTQDVALKLIKQGIDKDLVLRSFLRERRILADLDHPNIARMLDGGATSDGLPYLVMEYIDGQEIRRFCSEQQYGLEQRLEIFLKICSSVTAAHRNLVVHRDLKPSNILVTKDGEPKLLDFGIAKLLSPDRNKGSDEATITQFRVMTPEYASPEQMEGRAISTSTDVYSLGVILYELLAGERPYQSSDKILTELSNGVFDSQPPRPSVAASTAQSRKTVRMGSNTDQKPRVNTAVGNRDVSVDAKLLRGDLDNIILKALRTEQDRRYQSVEEFSEDIRRFQNGQPVTATADSRAYRFKKFFGRHTAGAVGVATAVMLLLTATVITGWQYSVARAEKAKAERRFQDVRQLANTILFDHYERIKELPGATEARQKLVSDALQYLDKLAVDSDSDPAILREVAAAYKKLAEVEAGAVSGGDMGDSDDSKVHIQKAIDILEQVISLESATPSDKRDLGKAYKDLGLLYDSDLQKSHELIEKGLIIFRELLETNPDRIQARTEYSTALWAWANIVRKEQGNQAAISTYKQSVAIREELIDADPGNLTAISNASLTYKNIGTLYGMEKDFQSSLEYYQKAFDMDSRLLSADPNNVQKQMALSFSRKGVGNAYLELGELQKALDEFQGAVAIQESVCSTDANNKFASKSLMRSYSDLADAYSRLERRPEAAKAFDKAIALATPVTADVDVHAQEAILRGRYGQFLLPQNRPHAIEQFRRSMAIFSELKKNNSFDPAYENDYNEVAQALKALYFDGS